MRINSDTKVGCACNGCRARRNNDAMSVARTIHGTFPASSSFGCGSGSAGANSSSSSSSSSRSSNSDSDSEHVANSYATRLRPRPRQPTIPITPTKTPRKGAAKTPRTPGNPAHNNDNLTGTLSGA
ncbi:hypothetical protein CPAR01_16420 [Colletotrichum paranaense]|uniref:Uncharacterized protein n=1 Tax=Colletotrichum paranaense TaxID=1914294 RepID=A0ABQ9RW01_9PEZI|nr:uncharacterized protein CPAR01_16420 [Colletotrichum paranaense]KAK1516101.1 hypothetical protein CPAR01_16420 [Colletotrichum paranaense]